MRSVTLTCVLTAFFVPGLLAADQAARKPRAAAKPQPAPAASAVTGTILETMDSGGYTYMLLKTPAGDVWAAVNQAKVKKGSAATVVNAVAMENFESKTLHRKFDRILFGTLAPASSKAG